jgi:hypothetical protein
MWRAPLCIFQTYKAKALAPQKQAVKTPKGSQLYPETPPSMKTAALSKVTPPSQEHPTVNTLFTQVLTAPVLKRHSSPGHRSSFGLHDNIAPTLNFLSLLTSMPWRYCSQELPTH